MEWDAKRGDTEQINACWTGPFPAFAEDADEEDETELTPELSPDLEANFPDELLGRRQPNLGNQTLPPSGAYPCDRYSFPTARGGLPTELPVCGSQKAHPAASSQLPLCIFQGLL